MGTARLRQTAAMLGVLVLLAGLAVRGQQTGLRIVVVEGQDAINVLSDGQAAVTVIEVRDGSGEPVGGAFVQFSLRGRNARLNGAFAPIEMLADEAGRARATLTPVARGNVRIDVTATFLGATATATITQRNVMTADEAAVLAARRVPARDTDGDELLPGARPEDRRDNDSSLASISVGAAAAGGGAIALYALRGNPPLIARATITGLASVDGPAIRGVTELTFTASTRDRSGDFQWEFGDGESATGQIVTHIYRRPDGDSFAASVTHDGEKTAAGTIRVGTLTGNWTSTTNQGLTHFLELRQDATRLSGSWTVRLDPDAPGNPTGQEAFVTTELDGTLTSPRGISIRQLGECQRSTSAGAVTADLNQLNLTAAAATMPGCPIEEGWTFRRQ